MQRKKKIQRAKVTCKKQRCAFFVNKWAKLDENSQVKSWQDVFPSNCHPLLSCKRQVDWALLKRPFISIWWMQFIKYSLGEEHFTLKTAVTTKDDQLNGLKFRASLTQVISSKMSVVKCMHLNSKLIVIWRWICKFFNLSISIYQLK